LATVFQVYITAVGFDCRANRGAPLNNLMAK
jgi:hypothetical protein